MWWFIFFPDFSCNGVGVDALINQCSQIDFQQSKIKPIVSVIKPFLNNATAISALEELETLASLDVNATTNVQGVPPLPQQPQTES